MNRCLQEAKKFTRPSTGTVKKILSLKSKGLVNIRSKHKKYLFVTSSLSLSLSLSLSKEKPHWFRKTTSREPPKQLQTYNVPTYNMENTNDTNKWGDL